MCLDQWERAVNKTAHGGIVLCFGADSELFQPEPLGKDLQTLPQRGPKHIYNQEHILYCYYFHFEVHGYIKTEKNDDKIKESENASV